MIPVSMHEVDPKRPVNMLAWALGTRSLNSQKGCGLLPAEQQILDAMVGETFSLVPFGNDSMANLSPLPSVSF